MTSIGFEEIQINIMKVLTGKPDEYISQYNLYNMMIENIDIKDPVEKENLKIRFVMVLRQLSSIFNNISIMEKHSILYAKFITNDDLDGCDVTNEHHSSSTYQPKSSDLLPGLNMPSQISVINFIIDENLDEYLRRKDYNGNTVLHSLVMENDFKRIKKAFSKLEHMIDEKNNYDETPIELIDDIRVSNIFLLHLMDKDDILELDILNLKKDLDKKEEYLNNGIYIIIFLLISHVFKLFF